MTNPGLDAVNLVSDDVLSDKRQAEIENLVKRLARFKPSKIAVEIRRGSTADSLLQINYTQYLAGKYMLGKHESEQVGFRLAKLLGHTKIFAIDVAGEFDMNKVMGFAMNNGMGTEAQGLMQDMQEFMKQEDDALKRSTVPEHFAHMNSPEFITRGWEVYQRFLTFHKDNLYPGADLFTEVFRRNLKIVSNLMRLRESEDDRVLVIYGAGHIPFFKNIITGNPDMEIVDALKYLK
ncbi:MAG: DUF5694 domain-containing protein [Bacteroidota bacterium]